MQKKKKRRESPQGDGEWDRKSLFEIIFYYQWLKYQQTDIIPLGSYTELLQRKLHMAWGTTTDRVTAEINPFQYAREIKNLTLKDIETYLILDG